MNYATAVRPGALSEQQMNNQLACYPGYRARPQAPAQAHAGVVAAFWGGPITPMMANAGANGRYSNAALTCPPTACTGAIVLDKGGKSKPWRNPDAIENLVCVEGCIDITYGWNLEHRLHLGKFDMVSLPRNLRLQLSARGDGARVVSVLSVEPQGTYDAAFDAAEAAGVDEQAAAELGLRFDTDLGDRISAETVEGRVTRFENLVPYKKDLNRSGGLPPEATMALSAGSVFPLIVPEGHVGRSRTAPMYGNQGLYMSIAECTAGDDGPPPHSHADTQESFYVLNGSFDICTGFDNERVVAAKPNDLFAVPSNVMRTFRNTAATPSRLLVIIQGPDRMKDLVSYSERLGDDFQRRFGADIIDKYAEIRMTFDAETRLGA